MNKPALALGALVLAGVPSLAPAQALTKCIAGQEVIDKEGKTGVIVSDDSKSCQVKYADGQTYSWIYWNLRPTAAPAKPGLATPGASPPGPASALPPSSTPSSSAQALTVLRPSPSRTLVYRADRRGHFTLTAAVNGSPIRLTHTANGPVRFAPVNLREIRIEQLSIENVPAAVIENLDQSLLGMSFLKRLKSFEMREGALAINW